MSSNAYSGGFPFAPSKLLLETTVLVTMVDSSECSICFSSAGDVVDGLSDT